MPKGYIISDDNIHRLTKAFLANPPLGAHADGGGLYLRNMKNDKGRSWVFSYAGTEFGEASPQQVSIGPLSKVDAPTARDRAAFFRSLLREDRSPKQHVEQERAARKKQIEDATTFGDAIVEYYNHGKGRLWIIKHGKCSMDYGYRWLKRFGKTEEGEELFERTLASITAEDLAEHIYPQKLWDDHPAIVRRIASFLIGLFSRATVRRRYHSPNPSKLGKHSELIRIRGPLPKGGNFRELPYDDIPLLMYHLMIAQYERRPGFVSVAEAAFGYERDPYYFIKLRKSGELPGSYKERNDPTAPWFLPIAGLISKCGEPKRPFPQYSQTDIDLYYSMLQFQILSLVRPEQVCQLRFGNINEKNKLITYRAATSTTPGEHKMGHHTSRNYTVIATPRMTEIIERMRQRRLRDRLTCNCDDYVFTHEQTRRGEDKLWKHPVAKGALRYNLHTLLARIPEIEMKNASVHAMRDSFTTWAGAERGYDHNLINLTLGKPIQAISENKANEPYWKAVMLKLEGKRRAMMEEWERYVLSMWNESRRRPAATGTGTVTPLFPAST
jgi:integrase